jgi:hypothetical protein
MNDLSFNVIAFGKYVQLSIMLGKYQDQEFINHLEAKALAEYLKEISDELMTCVQRVNYG